MKTYSTKSNAKQAAHRTLGKDKQEGRDFLIVSNDGKWVFDLVEREPPKVRARRGGSEKGTHGASKKERLIALLRQDGGVSATALIGELGWLPHTLRGALSLLGSKDGLKVESFKSNDGARMYRLPATP